jgi:hypothetical protein
MYQWPRLAPLRVCLAFFDEVLLLTLYFRIAPSPALLAYHFFSVAFYAIYVMFTHPQRVSPPPSPRLDANGNSRSNGAKPVYEVPSIFQYPALFVKSLRVVSPRLVSHSLNYFTHLFIVKMCSFGRPASCSDPCCGRRCAGGRRPIRHRGISSSSYLSCLCFCSSRL